MDPSLDDHEYCTGGFDPDDIVISGMAGRFPECDSTGEFKDGLYNKKNMIVFSDARYEKGVFGLPYSSCALIKRLDQYDAEFFQCSNTLANRFDPAARIHMEVTYEAIADAGLDACDLRGQRIGVFNATTADDSNKLYTAEEIYQSMTSMRSMNPNRTTYSMGFTGPSMGIDTACSSSGVALWAAVQSIKSGCIEAAVVSGCQLNLVPEAILGYIMLGIQSTTGNSRPYDINADGIIRAECICAIFLQKAKVARRAYASVIGTRFYSAGYIPEGIGVPSKTMQAEIMADTLKDAGVHPDEIQFVEGHATGTKVGDPIEANAMDSVFNTKTRKGPLLLGSVKCNIGHTEACSGLCSVIRAAFAFETGLIPPNINYDSPNPGSEALLEGRIEIVTDATPLTSDYIPVNSLGFGGTLVQVILKKNPRIYDGTKSASPGIPRLVLFPATTEEAITTVFDYVKNNPDLPEEFFALLSKLSFTDPFYKPFRGYAVYQKGKDPVTQIKNVTPSKRQVWFIMTGMGCQWPGMGLELMKIDVFGRSIRKSAEILKAYGMDLFEILRPDRNYFHADRKITASFVGICSIQIALVDVLRHLGIEPDGIIGHSAGELSAAYADGACTHEQALVASYLRGYAVETANLPEGGMAAVGMSFSEVEKICPKDVFAACDNAEDSVTISGLKEPLAKFVEKLQQENIFVRMVNSHGFGFHCKFIQDAAPLMRPSLQKLLPNPKPRTERWISTSYPESKWNTPDCKVCGSEYFCNNMVTSVRFTHALTKIPPDAIVIEIGPHYLLQSILKRAVGPKASYHGLMKRNDENNMLFFMESVGKLYQVGANPKIERLYPPVKFPVPRGTPMISDLIKWNHTQSFSVPKFSLKNSQYSKEFKLDKEDAYLMDHGVDGRKLFPGTGYVFLAWEALAAKLQKDLNEMPVVIENFKIERATITSGQSVVKFYVNIMDSSGTFEIIEGKSLVASGRVYESKKMTFLEGPPQYTSDDTCVSGRDIYDELKRSSYEYGPAFQSVVECSLEGTSGLIQWQGRWIPFLDAVWLFFGLIRNEKGMLLPTWATTIKIEPNILREYVRRNGNISTNREDSMTTCNIPCSYNSKTKLCRSIGIEVSHLNWDAAPVRGKNENPILEEYRFTPYVSNYIPSGSASLPFTQYFNDCNELMSKIGKALKKDTKRYQFQMEGQNDFRPEETGSSENKDLAKILETISNDPESVKSKRKEYLDDYIQTAGKDILNNALVNEDTLKIMLAIISENTYRKLSVVEVNRDFPVVLVPAVDTIKKYAHLKFKKSILIAPKSAVVDQEALEEQGIQQASSENILIDLEREKSQDVAISSFTCGPLSELENLLRTLTSIIKPNGFILLFFKEKANRAEQLLSAICGEELQVHSQAELESVLHSTNLLILSKISDPFGGSVYLLRAPYLETPQKVLQITDGNYEWVEKVKKELYEKNAGMLWLVSEDGPVNGILGMVNCLKQEPGGERIRCVFISRKKQENNFPSFSLEHPFFQNLTTKNLVMNVWKDGTWGSYRHILIKEAKPPRPMEHSYVNVRKYGDLSSFEWIESSVKYAPRENKKMVHIYYSAVNFKDVMLATGKLSIGTTPHQHLGNSVLGFEFSGREEGSGKRICGFAPARAMATSILAEPDHCLEVPQNWTLEEAATVPVVYATCYYSLITRARLQPGESVLIHSGSGGIGIAAITIALSMNCEVFTTVGNDEKRAYLRKKFPQIKDENIGCSRNISFETMVLSRTNGRGVDVILNSLADDKFQANFRCIAKSGRIVEIGKYDLALNRPINSKIFLENVSFHAVFLDQIFEGKGVIRDTMDLIRAGIKAGVVQPLDRTVFGRNAIEEAFRFMAKGVHVGKVLLKIRDEEAQKSAIPKTLVLPAVPDTQFFYNKVYIIIGGLGGFGMEVTKWAIDRGARNIILTSRYGARTPYHHFCLKRWKDEGLNVRVSTLNAAKRNEAEKLLQEAVRIGPLGGIFNSAVILKDAFMEVQTIEDYKEVCAPKADATKFLDELTRKLCPDIDYFVCFSSISGGRGNAGQTNYAYANSVMERICEERKKDGLHGLAIQWGIIGDVGVVHRHIGDDAMIAGVTAQSVKCCLQTLDIFCQQDCPVVTSYVAAEQSKKNVQGDALQQISKILGMRDVSQINMNRSLGEIGIDSMVGVEIKQMIESCSDVAVSMQEIQEMKFEDIKAIFETAESEKTTTKAPALMATANIKLPPILVHKDPFVVLNEQSTGEHVFIVHINDTDVMSFQPLAKALNRPVYALVWTKDVTAGDMESLAQWYLKLIQNIAKGPYHLMGVSDGACLAFEMALQSENSQNNLKSLTLITGSEHLMNTLSVDNTEKAQSEASAICAFIGQFTPSDLSRLHEELDKDLNLDQRIRTVFNYLTNSSSQMMNKNEISEAVSNYLLKHRILESYIPSGKLSRDINLLEDPSQFLANDVSIIKEIFTQFTSGKVAVHRVFLPRQLPTEDGAKRLATTLQTIV